MSGKKEKYMILCVAGQSNAVGYDESIVQPDYLSQFRRERIRQLGLYGEDNLKKIPLGVCAQSYQDLRLYSNPGNNAYVKVVAKRVAGQMISNWKNE